MKLGGSQRTKKPQKTEGKGEKDTTHLNQILIQIQMMNHRNLIVILTQICHHHHLT